MMIDEMTPLCKMLLEKIKFKVFFFVLVEEVKNIKTVLE